MCQANRRLYLLILSACQYKFTDYSACTILKKTTEILFVAIKFVIDVIENFQDYILAFYDAVFVSYANAVTTSFIISSYWAVS